MLTVMLTILCAEINPVSYALAGGRMQVQNAPDQARQRRIRNIGVMVLSDLGGICEGA